MCRFVSVLALVSCLLTAPFSALATVPVGDANASRPGAAPAGCTDLAVAASSRDAVVRESFGERGIRPTGGGNMWVIEATPGDGPGAPAPARFEHEIEVVEEGVLELDYQFLAGAADDAAWFAVFVDGLLVACGSAASADLQALEAGPGAGVDAGNAGERRATGWRSLVDRPVVLQPGAHRVEVFVGSGSSSAPTAQLFLDEVRVRRPSEGNPNALPPTPCRPAPPEDLAVIADPTSTVSRWTFDDNTFCPGGPGLACSRNLLNPNPGTSFVDRRGLAFEMYVVADCGTEMHVPLFDVESGCISVFDDARNPIDIRVTNGAGFDELGGEVCWSADFCDGQGLNMPGGPGENRVMDVSIQGSPTLCGVFIVSFRSWAGCIWDLFANCDGTQAEQFGIYDDLCQARAAFNPLPELVVEDLQLTDPGFGCSVDYCAVVRNIGCELATAHVIRVENEIDSDSHVVPSLAAGDVVQLCGTLSVTPVAAPTATTTVVASADPGDALLECTEDALASSCNPVTGGDQLSATQVVTCNQPPSCDAGAGRVSPCRSAAIEGATVTDPDDDAITYQWTSDRPDVTVSPSGGSVAAGPGPRVIPPATAELGAATAPCGVTAVLTLTVDDGRGAVATCTTTVTFNDDQPPTAVGLLQPVAPAVPASPGSARSACSPATSGAFQVSCSAADACDPAPGVTAQLVVLRHEVDASGTCVEQLDRIPVDCGELVTIHLIAPPCPSAPPRSAAAAVTVDSAGQRVFTGESVRLEVVATDHCGLVGRAGADPTQAPEPPCENPLDDGTCCPPLAAPAAPCPASSACGG